MFRAARVGARQHGGFRVVQAQGVAAIGRTFQNPATEERQLLYWDAVLASELEIGANGRDRDRHNTSPFERENPKAQNLLESGQNKDHFGLLQDAYFPGARRGADRPEDLRCIYCRT